MFKEIPFLTKSMHGMDMTSRLIPVVRCIDSNPVSTSLIHLDRWLTVQKVQSVWRGHSCQAFLLKKIKQKQKSNHYRIHIERPQKQQQFAPQSGEWAMNAGPVKF